MDFRLANPNLVGFVDVAVSETVCRHKSAGQIEVLEDVNEIRRQVQYSETSSAGVVSHAPRVKSGKSRELPRSEFEASLSGITADQAAAS